MDTLYKDIILDWASLFHWADRSDFVRAIKGRDMRLRGVEWNLPRLVKQKKLKRKRIGNKHVYALPRTKGYTDHNVKHGLMCTDALVRFHVSKAGDYISERDFKRERFDPIPEFGVRYNGGDAVVLLFEYSSPDQVRRKKTLHDKLKKYQNLGQFRKAFKAEPYLVHVLDAPEWHVDDLADKHSHNNNFYFTDARQFYSVPYGEQLSRAIYTWRGEKVSLYA